MSIIVLNDLDNSVELDRQALNELNGGGGYGYAKYGKEYKIRKFYRILRRYFEKHGYDYPKYGYAKHAVKYVTVKHYSYGGHYYC